MTKSDFSALVGPALAGALERKGYVALTPVQLAVLDPKLAGRDLRITSQTGSGKTVAIGLALREAAAIEVTSSGAGVARPRILVVAPTRELAKQVEEELGWLYAPLRARVTSVTGGASYRDERRSLGAGPTVVVGTPGRLLDHLRRGGVDPSQLHAVVLDEADRMLDLGFREDLEAILALTPPERLTHLMSATFPRDVRVLADKVQRTPALVEGTPLGTANTDIAHVVHLVDARHRVDAIVNLLLSTPDAQTLVFARTRADVARITRELADAGFRVSSLSGEMEQPERNRALAAFKRGGLHALVATDVAARGIDVQDIARVIHAEPPDDADAYTHRSGRTGRAGKKGTSCILVSPAGLSRTSNLLRRARVEFRVMPLPTAEDIRSASDERIFVELTGDIDEEPSDARADMLARRLTDAGFATRSLARLFARMRHAGSAEPRDLRPIEIPAERKSRSNVRAPAPSPRGRQDTPRARHDTAPRAHHEDKPRAHHEDKPRARHDDAPRAARDDVGWIPFRVSWGREQGADARRLLALVCRRGQIRGSDIGRIHIARRYAVVEVAPTVADAFARAAQEPDPRDPRVSIVAERPQAPLGGDVTPKRRSTR